ncbi:Sucrase/ferredoxin-like-domain-containing protein [Epithele typhae]|uniref:Sucrase/ferredoxin-like-domain-containing protein n=1 Tax=Epithele typhae TaxID=378194 RepID=UPI0020073CA8|nr:Sucrase/ferredoxin-like-domain-containing protein [Epithele typhae]KAH9918230.1 Sucrase/ferredoxin-like-domain-containing protein [Epithele typhae]
MVAYALGHHPEAEHAAEKLREASVPISDSLCRACSDPCDLGHDEYPKFDVDAEMEMLGSVKPYGRQVVISSGKTDWARDVTAVGDTLAAHLTMRPPPPKHQKITILNGSHRPVSHEDRKETVLVFPDYIVLAEVTNSREGAAVLWEHTVSPAVPLHVPPEPSPNAKSWILPYACVILLCSHKRRDNRCAIAAPKLEHALTAALAREGWEVHTEVEDPSLHGPALEDDPALQQAGTQGGAAADTSDVGADARQAAMRARLAAAAEEKRALIVFCSHIGGHKYAGNVIINTPRGVSVWYGRVTPHEVDAIVRETIIGGRILPALLRGGMNLCAPGHQSLHEW